MTAGMGVDSDRCEDGRGISPGERRLPIPIIETIHGVNAACLPDSKLGHMGKQDKHGVNDSSYSPSPGRPSGRPLAGFWMIGGWIAIR